MLTYIQSFYSELLKHTHADDLTALAKISYLDPLQYSKDLSNFLLKKSTDTGLRNIEMLVFSNNPYSIGLLNHIQYFMFPHDWSTLINTPNDEHKTILDQWLQNDAKPLEIGLLLLNKLDNDSLLKALTKSIICGKNKDDSDKYESILTHPEVPIELALQLIQFLTDQNKAEALLSVPKHKRNNLLLRAYFTNMFDVALNTITDVHAKISIIKYLKKYLLIKEASHFLGIDSKNSFFDAEKNTTTGPKDDSQSVAYSGLTSGHALNLIKKEINRYIPSVNFEKYYNNIREAFNLIVFSAGAKDYELLYQLNQYEAHYQTKPIIFPVTWEEHAITIAATQNYLIVSNRGQGKSGDGGVVIYQLNAPLSRMDILNLMTLKDQNETEDLIKTLAIKNSLGNPKTVYGFHQIKPQRHGTCEIANKKAIIPGLQLALKLEENPELINNYTDKDEQITAIMDEYKKFTFSTREHTLQEILLEVSSDSFDDYEYIDVLTNYCNQHLDVNKKSELILIEKIYKSLNDDCKPYFMNNLNSASRYIINHLLHHGLETQFPEILTKIYYYDDLQKQLELSEAIVNLLNGHSSVKEATKWCTDFFYFLLNNEFYDILAKQLELALVEPSFIKESRFKRNIDSLIELAQGTETEKNESIITSLSLLFSKTPAHDKIALITPSMLRKTQSGHLLSIIIEGLEKDEIIKLFSEKDSLYRLHPLDNKHDIAYFSHLADKIGKDAFSTLLLTSNQTLSDNLDDAYIFNYLISFLSNEQIKEYIDTHVSEYKGNLFNVLLSKNNQMSNEFVLLNLTNLLSKCSPDDIKRWLTEKLPYDQSTAFENCCKHDKLLNLVLPYFTEEEIMQLQPSVKQRKESLVFTHKNEEATPSDALSEKNISSSSSSPPSKPLKKN